MLIKGLIKKVSFFCIFCIIFFVSFNITNADFIEDQTACSSLGGIFLPKCKTGCSVGCQPGYYLSDGDGDHTNNCLEVDGSGHCNKSNVKGICEICPPGFYCKGGMKDKIACAKGTYTSAPGSVQASDCKTPPLGYCVAKAKLVGTETATIPSVCVETPTGILSGKDLVDIPGAVNTAMANDEGIKGYNVGMNPVDDNKKGANIVIPCPLGTYDIRTDNKVPNAACKYPEKGKCTSTDGINCSFYETTDKGVTLISATNITSAIVTSANFGDCADGSKPNDEGVCANGSAPTKIRSGLGSTKQIPCPVGTYDLRTKVANSDYNNPSPFCIYPDIGFSTGTNPGSFTQTKCIAGTYDSRSTYSGGVFTPYSISPENKPHSKCTSCPIGTYQPSEGQTYCIYPPAGKYAPSTGMKTLSSLSSCPAGTYDSRNQPNSDVVWSFTDNTSFDPIIGTKSPLNYTSGKVNPLFGTANSCTACPAGTYQDETGKIYCKYPSKLYCSSFDGVNCSEQLTGMYTQANCKDEQYDPRQGNLSKPNPNCTGCTNANYTDWYLNNCQPGDTFYATRTPKTVSDWSKCNDTIRPNFGYCDYCSDNNQCASHREENNNTCDDRGPNNCAFGYEHKNDCNGQWCIGCCNDCHDDCYYMCYTSTKYYCENVTNRCSAGYRFDNFTCISCPTISGPNYWNNAGITCDWSCPAGYSRGGASCDYCGGIPTYGYWTNPGNDCSWTCGSGYYRSGSSCLACSDPATVLQPNWSSNCSWSCPAPYTKNDKDLCCFFGSCV